MSQNDVAQAGRFTNKSAGHYNRLSLRNGVSLNGLTRNPLDLEIFFQAALFFISQAGKDDFLDQETFLARLEFSAAITQPGLPVPPRKSTSGCRGADLWC